MGVEFRWQLGSEQKWDTSEPMPQAMAGVVAVGGTFPDLVGIVIGIFWQRVREGQARLRRELYPVAGLETQAVRGGDRETFLSLQDRDDTQWYKHQKERFWATHG